MKKLLLLILMFGFGLCVTAKQDTLKLYTVTQLEDNMKVNPKPIIIYYYTDWCKYCKVMDVKTFTDSVLIDSLNANYYMVKFNAESKTTIKFLGRDYKFIKTGNKQGYHEFCYIFDRITGYPSLVFLNTHFELIESSMGYLNSEDLKKKIE